MAASKRAASYGKKVAVADFIVPSPQGTTWGLGGTCVNVGCIPKKLFHFAASVPTQTTDMANFGWNTKQTHNWEKMVSNVNNYIKGINFASKNELRSADVKYYNKYAKFIDPHTIELTDAKGVKETVTAEKILVASGGRPNNGDYPGADEHCINSDDIFWRKKPPGKTLVVGASYIALECAGFLNGLGFDTTVMVRSILLRGFDQEIAGKIGEYMEEEGVKFAHGMVPTKFEKEGEQIVAYTKDGEFGKFDTVLLAIGRKGNGGKINLEAAGVEYNKNTGKIPAPADHSEGTNVEHIFCIGDALEGRPELTPVAIKAGQMLADRLYGGSNEYMDYKNIATTVFTPLEYGTVGMSEEDIKDNPDDYTVFQGLFKPLVWALSDHRGFAFIKVLVEKSSDLVVGIHVLGLNAAEIIQGFSAAVQAGLTKKQMDRTVGIHPCDAEALTMVDQIKVEGQELEAPGGC